MAVYTPTLADVGAFLTSRTVDSNGNETGTFSTDTRPTAAQVSALIAHAEALTAPALGVFPSAYDGAAKALVALRAAIMVERSYFPDQADTPQSVIPSLEEEYDKSLTAFQMGAKGDAPNGYRVGTIGVGTELVP